MRARFPLAAMLLAGAFCGSAQTADWPQFGRDQTRNAVSPEKNPPAWWQFEERDDNDKDKILKPNKNIRWRADLNGWSGYGNVYGDPVIVDGLVWVGSNHWKNVGKDDIECCAALVCLDEKTGKELYRHVSKRLGDGWLQGGRWHSHSSSPLIEGDTLWVVTNRCEVLCLDIGPLKKRTGEPREVWKVDMRKELGVKPRATLNGNRRCSVASHKDWIYVITGNGVQYDDQKPIIAENAPSLVCFNKTTGKVVWKDNSPGKNILHGQYASPTVIEVNGKVQVVAPQGDGWLRSFDAATGKPIWQFDTNPHDSKYDDGHSSEIRNYLPATAVFYENRLYIGNGQEQGVGSGVGFLYCIDPSKTGDISPEFTSGPNKGKPNTNSGMVWKYGGVDENAKRREFEIKYNLKRGIFERTLSNVAVHNGLVISLGVGGTVYCLDARTGQLHWSHTTKGTILGSPLIVDGKVFVATSYGGIWVFELSKVKKVIAELEKDTYCMCSPVFANGVLYVASERYLFAIAGDEKSPKK